MSARKRLFWLLWALGMAGVLSFLLVDLSALIAAVPTTGEPVELPPPALLKVISLIQPTILLTLAVLGGLALAGRVGLHAPAAEAWAGRESYLAALKPQIVPGIVAGLAGGVAIVLTWVVAKPSLTPEFIRSAEEFNNLLPHVTRFLYGGLTEELLLRWGVMTLIAWAAWRVLQRGQGEPKAAYFVAAILLAALLFGIGHLPIAAMLNGSLTLPLTIYVVTANSIFGIAAGFLYWRRGLEAAMIAHIFAHVVLIIAISLAF
jgi:hypothetical protein